MVGAEAVEAVMADRMARDAAGLAGRAPASRKSYWGFGLKIT
jgi:hypothetical protein